MKKMLKYLGREKEGEGRVEKYHLKERVKEVLGSNPTDIRDFFFFSAWVHFLSKAIAQKILFGILIQHFNLQNLNRYSPSNSWLIIAAMIAE